MQTGYPRPSGHFIPTNHMANNASNTYKVLTITQPPYLHNLISVQCPRSTRSSSVITLTRPSTSSSLEITGCSFRYALPCLCNQLPLRFRQPHSSTSSSTSDSPIHLPISSFSSVSPLCSFIISSLFHSRLETYLFHKSYPVVLLLTPGLPSRTFCLHRFC